MGLFDKLAKQGLGSLKDKLEKATGVDLDGALTPLADAVKQAAARVEPARYDAPEQAPRAAVQRPDDWNAYFASILQTSFPQYAVQTAVPSATLGFPSASPAKPYDFALIDGGGCRGVIMLTPHNRDNNAAFKNARAAADRAGVAFINFYTHFPNERNYVIDRVRRFLG